MGAMVGSLLRQALRQAGHSKRQKTGYQMIAQRLQVTVPWQPEMLNYPSFLCAHCQFPHILRQTLLGCTACAAPYFPSEVVRLNKNGRLMCVACAFDQSIDEMPFCCTNCRCIQGVPTNLDWRKTFAQLPMWRVYGGSLSAAVLGLLVILSCLFIGQTNREIHAEDLTFFAIFLGLVPLGFGVVGLVTLLSRRNMPAEMLLSCGGFGYRTTTGEELWFAWRDVGGLDTKQQMLNMDTASAHPDSTATGWTIRAGQERLSFDNRLENAREFARQIRMRSPAAPLADLAPSERSNPWVVACVLLLVGLICARLIYYSKH